MIRSTHVGELAHRASTDFSNARITRLAPGLAVRFLRSRRNMERSGRLVPVFGWCSTSATDRRSTGAGRHEDRTEHPSGEVLQPEHRVAAMQHMRRVAHTRPLELTRQVPYVGAVRRSAPGSWTVASHA